MNMAVITVAGAAGCGLEAHLLGRVFVSLVTRWPGVNVVPPALINTRQPGNKARVF